MRLGSKSIKGSFDVCRSGRFLFYTKNKMVFVKMRKLQIPTKEKTWCHHFLLFVNVSNPMHKGANTNRLSQNRSAGDRFQSKGGLSVTCGLLSNSTIFCLGVDYLVSCSVVICFSWVVTQSCTKQLNYLAASLMSL